MDVDTTLPLSRHVPDLSEFFPTPDDLTWLRSSAAISVTAEQFMDRYQLAPNSTYRAKIVSALPHGGFLSYVYPDVDQDAAQLAVDLIGWFMVFDDLHVEAAMGNPGTDVVLRIFGLLGVLDEQAVEPGPGFEAALCDLLERCTRFTVQQQRAIRAALYGILMAWLWESQLDTRQVWPSLQTYATVRRHTAFAAIYPALIEPLGDIAIPGLARQDANLRQLKEAMINLNSWFNDVMSFRKEQREQGGIPISLPGVLMRERGCSLDESLTLAKQMIHDEAENAVATIAELTQSPVDSLRSYAACAERTFRATTFWYASLAKARYS
ncbi:terpene synthase family protein [Streptomyces sp. LN549]|uniref:terpene synthase family protein n=1 Tax=Streptomyces sp. LN549 TaxID=3112979 RepID=UPI003720005F